MIEGALGNVQFLTQGFDGLAFFVSADCFDFEFRWIIRWHRINPFVANWSNEWQTIENTGFFECEIPF